MSDAGPVRLRVQHRTRFDYQGTASQAHSEVRKTPRDTPRQRVLHTHMQVTPHVPLRTHTDHFGNRVHHVDLLDPHSHVEFIAETVVETRIPHRVIEPPDGCDRPADARVRAQRFAEFLGASPGVPPLAEYATVPHSAQPDQDTDDFRAALCDVAAYFFQNFRYDPDVTHVHSSPQDLFTHGGGVCQDMAHALIGVLRESGVPARYVSGYIYDPKKDEEGAHLRGAMATHAWVQAWHPTLDWVGVDPTNNCLVDWQYVRAAIGRDYFDVQPVRGVFRGTGAQHLSVSVSVHREAINDPAPIS